MNRRQYLARAGAAGSSVGALAGLAGCLDDLSGSSGGDEGDAGTDDGAGSRAGVRAIDRAAGRLNDAAKALDELEGLENPDAVEFDPEPPRTAIAEARDHLETAESELGEDRRADIATLRSYADALEGLVAVTATVTDDAIADDIDTVTTAIESEGDIETASETVDDRSAEIAAAHERWDEANTTIRDLDGDRLGDLTGVDPADLEAGAAALGDTVSSLETLAAAYDATLDLEAGYGALERGREHSDDREFEAARTAFETAESTFSASQRRLENGLADAPEGLASHFETAECQNRRLAAAAAAFAAAATAASNGNPLAAKEHRSEGEAELESVGNCS
ncbi:hypothetical protein [Natrinema salaciae]|uniref:Uncharacterized protein n=1 Tax=Natrinema salaciae TaxID=1186196 RepID=A0A1H9JER1_9EURY|nr:hypothetical protein [Natrinema salaciae]SEQ85332.1 hypothetical protein SAMN04489841_2527 [Natrinema salaciae]